MNNTNIIKELEFLYKKFMDLGDINKASEIIIKISDLKMSNESKTHPNKNILLG